MNIIVILLSALFISCAHAQNYKDAHIIVNDKKVFIKLNGKRERMVHDPKSISSESTYEDSILIQIPELKDGIINGQDIPVRKGQYKFRGNISIDKDYLQVNLLIDDTDNKSLRPLSWNGKYIIKSSM